MPRAARDACGARTSRAEGSACRGPRRWRSGQGPGGGLQGDLEALSLSPPALVGPAAMGPSHGELLLRDCPKGPEWPLWKRRPERWLWTACQQRGTGPRGWARAPLPAALRTAAPTGVAGGKPEPSRRGVRQGSATGQKPASQHPLFKLWLGTGVTSSPEVANLTHDTFGKRLPGPEPKGNEHRPHTALFVTPAGAHRRESEPAQGGLPVQRVTQPREEGAPARARRWTDKEKVRLSGRPRREGHTLCDPGAGAGAG